MVERIFLSSGGKFLPQSTLIIFCDRPLQFGRPRTFECRWHHPESGIDRTSHPIPTTKMRSCQESSVSEAAAALEALREHSCFSGGFRLVSKRGMCNALAEYPSI